MRRLLPLILLPTFLCPLPTFADQSTGLDAASFDKSVRVQDDLYMAVNGRWLNDTPIPEDKSNYGSFTILQDLSQERLKAIIEAAAEGEHPTGSDAQKVGDMYRSFMDVERVNELGIEPLAAELATIDAIQDLPALVDYLGYALQLGIGTPLRAGVGQDDKDSTRYLTMVMQGGTTLPDRDFYLEDDERYREAQEALKQHIRTLFQLAGRDSDTAADDILALETKLAEIQWSRTELRDANKRYNKFTLAEAQNQIPDIDWVRFFEAGGFGQPAEMNIVTPSFFEGLQAILQETPLDTWRDYLTFKLIDSYAPALSDAFSEAHFELHQRVLAGVPTQKPRWERAVAATAGRGAGDFGVVGDLVGRLYVQQHFPPEAKQRMTQLVANLLRAYEQSIGELTWMTDVTKEKALQKLAKITTKIGYPDKWRDYDALEIKPDDLAGNLMRSAKFEHERDLKKLGQPVDREEWGMTPQTVNAYYNPGMNEIVFPAAILQPPFFSMEADDAVNYGGIGAVIGHEISHGFDDQGSKYDGDGNLKDWWNAKDRYEFTQLTQRLIDQYSEYEPLPGKTVNGELTLGENIADLSGLAIAYKAYQLSLEGGSAPEIDGWTANQRFFMGWSQVWRRKYRDAEMIRRLLTDPHSPSWYRANGPVVNIDAFYEAFNVQPDDALYRAPEERIKIW